MDKKIDLTAFNNSLKTDIPPSKKGIDLTTFNNSLTKDSGQKKNNSTEATATNLATNDGNNSSAASLDDNTDWLPDWLKPKNVSQTIRGSQNKPQPEGKFVEGFELKPQVSENPANKKVDASGRMEDYVTSVDPKIKDGKIKVESLNVDGWPTYEYITPEEYQERAKKQAKDREWESFAASIPKVEDPYEDDVSGVERFIDNFQGQCILGAAADLFIASIFLTPDGRYDPLENYKQFRQERNQRLAVYTQIHGEDNLLYKTAAFGVAILVDMPLFKGMGTVSAKLLGSFEKEAAFKMFSTGVAAGAKPATMLDVTAMMAGEKTLAQKVGEQTITSGLTLGQYGTVSQMAKELESPETFWEKGFINSLNSGGELGLMGMGSGFSGGYFAAGLNKAKINMLNTIIKSPNGISTLNKAKYIGFAGAGHLTGTALESSIFWGLGGKEKTFETWMEEFIMFEVGLKLPNVKKGELKFDIAGDYKKLGAVNPNLRGWNKYKFNDAEMQRIEMFNPELKTKANIQGFVKTTEGMNSFLASEATVQSKLKVLAAEHGIVTNIDASASSVKVSKLEDDYIVEMVDSKGKSLTVSERMTKPEADIMAENAAYELNNQRLFKKINDLTADEVAKVNTTCTIDKVKLVDAQKTPIDQRTPEQNKIMVEYEKFIDNIIAERPKEVVETPKPIEAVKDVEVQKETEAVKPETEAIKAEDTGAAKIEANAEVKAEKEVLNVEQGKEKLPEEKTQNMDAPKEKVDAMQSEKMAYKTLDEAARERDKIKLQGVKEAAKDNKEFSKEVTKILKEARKEGKLSDTKYNALINKMSGTLKTTTKKDGTKVTPEQKRQAVVDYVVSELSKAADNQVKMETASNVKKAKKFLKSGKTSFGMRTNEVFKAINDVDRTSLNPEQVAEFNNALKEITDNKNKQTPESINAFLDKVAAIEFTPKERKLKTVEEVSEYIKETNVKDISDMDSYNAVFKKIRTSKRLIDKMLAEGKLTAEERNTLSDYITDKESKLNMDKVGLEGKKEEVVKGYVDSAMEVVKEFKDKIIEAEKATKKPKKVVKPTYSNGRAIFTYDSINDVPTAFADKNTGVITVNGKEIVRVTMSKSEAKEYLREAAIEDAQIISEAQSIENIFGIDKLYIDDIKDLMFKFKENEKEIVEKLSVKDAYEFDYVMKNLQAGFVNGYTFDVFRKINDTYNSLNFNKGIAPVLKSKKFKKFNNVNPKELKVFKDKDLSGLQMKNVQQTQWFDILNSVKGDRFGQFFGVDGKQFYKTVFHQNNTNLAKAQSESAKMTESVDFDKKLNAVLDMDKPSPMLGRVIPLGQSTRSKMRIAQLAQLKVEAMQQQNAIKDPNTGIVYEVGDPNKPDYLKNYFDAVYTGREREIGAMDNTFALDFEIGKNAWAELKQDPKNWNPDGTLNVEYMYNKLSKPEKELYDTITELNKNMESYVEYAALKHGRPDIMLNNYDFQHFVTFRDKGLDAVEQGLDAQINSPTKQAGSTNTRDMTPRPIRLDLGNVVKEHIKEVMTDVYFRDNYLSTLRAIRKFGMDNTNMHNFAEGMIKSLDKRVIRAQGHEQMSDELRYLNEAFGVMAQWHLGNPARIIKESSSNFERALVAQGFDVTKPVDDVYFKMLDEVIADNKSYSQFSESLNKTTTIGGKAIEDIIVWADKKVTPIIFATEFAKEYKKITGEKFDPKKYDSDLQYRIDNYTAIEDAKIAGITRTQELFNTKTLLDAATDVRLFTKSWDKQGVVGKATYYLGSYNHNEAQQMQLNFQRMFSGNKELMWRGLRDTAAITSSNLMYTQLGVLISGLTGAAYQTLFKDEDAKKEFTRAINDYYYNNWDEDVIFKTIAPSLVTLAAGKYSQIFSTLASAAWGFAKKSKEVSPETQALYNDLGRGMYLKPLTFTSDATVRGKDLGKLHPAIGEIINIFDFVEEVGAAMGMLETDSKGWERSMYITNELLRVTMPNPVSNMLHTEMKKADNRKAYDEFKEKEEMKDYKKYLTYKKNAEEKGKDVMSYEEWGDEIDRKEKESGSTNKKKKATTTTDYSRGSSSGGKKKTTRTDYSK